MICDILAVGTAIALCIGNSAGMVPCPLSPNIKKEEVMKKSTIAIPVALALLSFGVATQSMANPTNTSTGAADDQIAAVVGVADDNGNNATEGAIAVKDTLNNNKVDVKDVANTDTKTITVDKSKAADADVDLDDSDYNAVATLGDATVDKSIHIKVKDVNIATLKSDVKGEVKDVKLSVGSGVEQKSIGNAAEAVNASAQKNDADQYAKSSQSNKQIAVNASLQLEKSKQDADAVGVNVPVGVNVNGNDDQSATSGVSTDQDQGAAALQANKSKDPANKADVDNKADQDADAKVKSDQDQANKAKVANDADLANTTTQTALADAGTYTSTQSQTVSLTTGSNSMDNMSVNGVNAIAQNSGVQSFIQQTQNVQANVY
jgi:hypothetical protein